MFLHAGLFPRFNKFGRVLKGIEIEILIPIFQTDLREKGHVLWRRGFSEESWPFSISKIFSG